MIIDVLVKNTQEDLPNTDNNQIKRTFQHSLNATTKHGKQVCKWEDSEGPLVWGTSHWQESMRVTSSLFQKWHEVDGHGHQVGSVVNDCSCCWDDLHRGLEQGEKKSRVSITVECAQRTLGESIFTYIVCNQDCHTHVSLYSYISRAKIYGLLLHNGYHIY